MKHRRWISTLLIGLLLVVVTGCGMQPMGSSLAPEDQSVMPEAPVEVGDREEAPAGSAGRQNAGVDISPERMVIRTAELDLVVSETEEALDEIEELAQRLGGYVVSLDTQQYDAGIRGQATIRIPAESFHEAVDEITALATTVRRETLSSEDVTADYVDLESSLRHLRAKEAQLLEFLDQAEDTEAVLAVYEQLAQTQAEIEQVTGQMQYLENQAALSTVRIYLTPDALAQPLEVSGWNVPGTFRAAVESLLDVLQFVVEAAIYVVVVALPTLAIVALPVVGFVLLVRWLVRRSRKRSRAKKAAEAPDTG
jgi:hypothetical protein